MEIYKNARLIGTVIGNLESLKKYADLPDYQREWLKVALRAVKEVDYINIQNKF